MSTVSSELSEPEVKQSRLRQFFRRASEDDPVPVFHIVALGNRGSGKTVFLTAFAQRLQFLTDSRRYSLRVIDENQRRQLGNAYEKLANGSWPKSTGASALDFTTYRFAVNIAHPQTGASDHLFDVEWIDYAGELVDDPNPGSSADDQLKSHVRDANVIFCLLDGDRLRRWIDGDIVGHKYVHHEIHKLVGLAQEARGSVHVLITKWDAFARTSDRVFPGEAGQLEMLKAALMGISGFSDLRRGSVVGQPKRFIPVSAVGSGFTTTGPSGEQLIVSNANPNGQNLDVPFAAVVLDYLQGAVERLTPRERRVIKSPLLRRLPGMVDFVLSGTSRNLLRSVSPEHILAAGILDLVRTFLKPAPSAGTSDTSSRSQLIEDLQQRLKAFQSESPASVLGLPAWAQRG